MNKQLSKRAVQARKWRDNARETRRLNKVIAKYVQHKHKDIYVECQELFQAIKEKYPNLGPKCDLTKTRMFRRLTDTDNSSDCEESPAGQKSVPATSNGVFTLTTTSDPVTNTAADDFTAADTQSVPPAGSSQAFTDTTISDPVINTTPDDFTVADNQTVPPTGSSHAFTTTTTSDPVINTATDDFTVAETESVPPDHLIPVQHMHIQYNSLGELVEEITNEGEYVNANSLRMDLLNDIVNDLEHDESINEILNDVPMQQEEDDEGIGLVLENEVEDLLDFNVEFDF